MSGDAIAGYVTLDWQPAYPPFQAEGIPEIQDLNVLPRFQQHGLGTSLLNAAEQIAGTRATVVGLGVGLSADYGPAQRLYVKHGYIPDGRGVTYYDRTVDYGEQVVVDDDLVLHFVKPLSS